MSDLPGRSALGPEDRAGAEQDGWGSPVPAQYGSLRSVRPPAASEKQPAEQEAKPEPVPAEDDGHDLWGVGSLLRRLQGDPKPSDGDAPAAPDPAPAASPPPASSPSASSPPADQGPVGAAGRRMRWYDDPPQPSTADASPAPPAARPARAAGGLAQPGRPTPGAAATAGAAAAGAAAGGAAAPRGGAADAAPVSPPADPTQPPGGPVRPPAAIGIDPAELVPGPGGPDVVMGGRRRRRRPARTRTRATIRHVDIATVIRVSLLFWLVILVALVVASLLLWVFADAFGSLPSIDKSIRTLFSLKSFELHPGMVAEYTAAFGVVLAVAGMLGTIILALIYNLIADVVGGVRVELESFSGE